jgi:hypothetical protein
LLQDITAHGNSIPAAVAEMIARAMPEPRHETIAAIYARMLARHKKVIAND